MCSSDLSVGIVPGGVTATPTVDMITSFLWKLRRLQDFINNTYIPDVLAVAGAYPDYFSAAMVTLQVMGPGTSGGSEPTPEWITDPSFRLTSPTTVV